MPISSTRETRSDKSFRQATQLSGVVRTARQCAESRGILWKVSALFALDSVAGGFLTTALLSFFFHERLGVGVDTMGLLFVGAGLKIVYDLALWRASRLLRPPEERA